MLLEKEEEKSLKIKIEWMQQFTHSKKCTKRKKLQQQEKKENRKYKIEKAKMRIKASRWTL